jgi:ribosomal protein S18 acetylase RimI-like enzyme
MSVVIRSMRDGEEDDVATLLRQLPRDLGLGVEFAVTGAALKAAKGLAEISVAEDAGLILGVCCWVMTYSTQRAMPGIYICDLFILGPQRGRGIGEALLKGVMTAAAKRGASFIKMEVDVSNEGAARFYERLGFHHKPDDRYYALESSQYNSLLQGGSGSGPTPSSSTK